VSRTLTKSHSVQLIGDLVGDVLQRYPEAQLIGIRTPVRQAWPATIERDGVRLGVLWAESALALREALIEADGKDRTRLVVLTNLPDAALGADLLARFPKARLWQPDAWQTLKSAFNARAVDSRLAGEDWLLELLIEHAPQGGYAPVPGGVLDADTAWRHVLERAIGLDAERPDASAVLDWTLEPARVERYLALPQSTRERIAAYMESVGGSAVGLAMGALANGHGADAVPLGLVLTVVLANDKERELRDAAVRLEQAFGRRIERKAALRLAGAAELAVARLDEHLSRAAAERCQDRAADWLKRLHIDGYAHLSDHLASGFDQRLSAAADALRGVVESNAPLAEAESAVAEALAHSYARQEARRAERARMALRLVRWLRSPETETGETRLAAAAADYARDGGFADLARAALQAGDHRADVSATYALIATQATARRERANAEFAKALHAWAPDAPPSDDIVPVEHFLDRVLIPIARTAPVLLLVLDGLSFAVYRELSGDLTRQDLVELVPEGRAEMPSLIAALPSVTEVSRTSLLTGRLMRGNAQDERKGFTQHAGLLATCRAGLPPLLFHKGGLGTAAGLTDDVCEAVADAHRRVVGVVHNAVDAQLDGSDQLDLRWSLDDLRFARALLRYARDAGRIVVLASDHGHVLDHSSTTYVQADGGARWRPAEGATDAFFELTFEGGRVLSPAGERRVVLPWSEAVRYGAKSRGYHGGSAPQEIVAPLAVLCARFERKPPQGWILAPPVEPEWWERAVEPTSPSPPPQPRKSRAADREPDLFTRSDVLVHTDAETDGAWIDRLLATPTYAAQKRLAGRIAPPDETVAELLRALDERRGRLTETALAKVMHQPIIRIGGLISATARVLNVDQAPVLQLDRRSATVTLDRALLERQFELRKV
jgi:hypothetical protein